MKICSLDYYFGVGAENLILLSEQAVFWKNLLNSQNLVMCAKACWRVDLERVLEQLSLRCIRAREMKILQCISVGKIILQCIREKFCNVS